MGEPTRWQAIMLFASVGLALLSPLCIAGEALFTTADQRPSRWSGASLALLVAAFICLTIVVAPALLGLWHSTFA